MNRVFLFLALLSFTYSNAKKIVINNYIENDSIFLDIKNGCFAPFKININILLEEHKAKIRYQDQIIIAANDTLQKFLAVPLTIIKDTSIIKLNDVLSIKVIMGNPYHSKHDVSYKYTLPFKKEISYRITQGFHGKKAVFLKKV